MPQIANQDYNVVNGFPYEDLAFLAGAYERGTIFDVIFLRDRFQFRPLTIVDNSDETSTEIQIKYINKNGQIDNFLIQYTEKQYRVMGDIQNAGADPTSLCVDENGYLLEMDTDLYVCFDGKYIAVTLDESDYIASYVVTDVEAVGVTPVNIPEEDLPGLIGIYAGN